jgi:hypothetical protein
MSGITPNATTAITSEQKRIQEKESLGQTV